jgi:hypothetical protein
MTKLLRLLIALAFLAAAQEALNNDSVVKMVKAGLGDGLIVSMIQSQPGKYSLTPDDLVNLKQQGVSEKVLTAMVSKGTASAPSTAAASGSTLPADADIPPGIDIGVFYKKGGKWLEMLPEVVNWKTGGVIKTIASAGIVKGDINGHIPGEHSRNSAASPLEILIYAPEGVAITEYQLLHLREEKNSREFRTVTGGVMHVSGGATRDVVPFEGTKVANRMYKVLLPNLGAGEYGFLPPGAVTSSNSASIGKMYTFRVIE